MGLFGWWACIYTTTQNWKYMLILYWCTTALSQPPPHPPYLNLSSLKRKIRGGAKFSKLPRKTEDQRHLGMLDNLGGGDWLKILWLCWIQEPKSPSYQSCGGKTYLLSTAEVWVGFTVEREANVSFGWGSLTQCTTYCCGFCCATDECVISIGILHACTVNAHKLQRRLYPLA